MAPHSKMDKSDVKLLVADEHSFGNAKVEARTELMRFACKNPNTVHFINREDNFASTLTKLGQVCRRNVTRLYYTDSDNDEVPIDGELEFSEALKIIGHRTEKGIFTEMRIDTGNPIKVMKKKVKKSKSKALSKVTEAPSFSNKGSKNEPSDKNSSDMEQPPAWFENYMVKFKADLVADFTRTTENVVKPLFSTTWDLIKICGINGSTFKSDEVKESASSGVSKMLTEADHNYSIASSSKKADDFKVLAGKAKMSGTVPVDCQKESNNTPFCHIRSETTYEDDNLSINSGEISVTDSESDFEGDSDDFVNIPLPACFNVIDQQKGSLGKELKPTKTEQEPKPDDAAASGALTSNLVKSQKNLYEKLLQLRKSHSEQYVTKSKSSLCNQDVGEVDVHSTDDSTVQDSSGLNVSNKLVHGKEEDCAEVDAEKIQDTNVTHIAPQLSEAQKSTPAAVPTVAPNENRAKDELWVPESPQPTCVLKKAPTAPQYAHPYMLQPGMFANSPQVPPFFSNGLPQNMFHQRRMYVVPPTQPNQKRLVQLMPSGGLPTYSSVSHPTMQPANVQQVAVNASQQFASHLLEAQAAVHAQHQQVVQAARRAQVQALAKVQQQTSALQVPHQKAPPVATSQTMPLNLKVNSAQGKNLSAKPTNPSTPYKHGVCTPQPAQQGALEMLSEVEQVDQELRKWVQVCQQLIEHILERPDETSPTMPESLKTLAATAITTHEDLERVYQRFRKEVETVSSQVDARKHQRQQQQTLEQALTDEPISILPEKLLEIISSTLSATFSILGNISKLGVVNASSSVPLEQSIRGPVAMEKTQPHVAAAISPPKSGLAYPLPLGYCHQLAPFDVPNYTITDAFENRDGSINSRMPPMASAPTPSSNVMITARQNSYLNPQAMVPRRQETTSTKYVVREFPPQLQTTLPVHPQIQMQPLQSQQQKQPQTQCPTKAFELLQMHHIQQQRAVQQALQGVHAVQSQIPPQMQPPFTTLRESGRHDLIFPPHCFDF